MCLTRADRFRDALQMFFFNAERRVLCAQLLRPDQKGHQRTFLRIAYVLPSDYERN